MISSDISTSLLEFSLWHEFFVERLELFSSLGSPFVIMDIVRR